MQWNLDHESMSQVLVPVYMEYIDSDHLSPESLSVCALSEDHNSKIRVRA